MKYFYFILLALLITFFFVFANLNPKIIELDLFFVKIEGVSVGFSMISSVLIGAIVSLILQLPKLFKKNSKEIHPKANESN